MMRAFISSWWAKRRNVLAIWRALEGVQSAAPIASSAGSSVTSDFLFLAFMMMRNLLSASEYAT